MAKGITGLENLNRTLAKTSKQIGAFPKQTVKILGTVRNNILNTTKSGVDANGVSFEKYSKRYRDFRMRPENHRQGSPVSLTWTGNMLRSMKVFNIKNGGEIKFDDSGANNLAVKHNEGKGVPKREFFGLNKKNTDYITNRLFRTVTL